MTNTFPMTILAQLGDVTVFQTSAIAPTVTERRDVVTATTAAPTETQQMWQKGQASYGELNLGLHVNDNASKVLDNRMRLLATINEQLAIQYHLSINRLHWVNQVHGKQIHDIDADKLAMRPMDADAIVSQQDKVGLAIMTADCVPIVLYQPTSGRIAAIHAGWQGLACGVIKSTAERFTETGQIVAWIGVCISQAHYEVSSQVRDKLLAGCIENTLLPAAHIQNFSALFSIPADTNIEPESLEKTTNKPANESVDTIETIVDEHKIKVNLPKLAHEQLLAAGITVCNDAAIACSYADAHYYSYRRQTHLQQPATGRMALVIVRSAPMTDSNRI